MVDEKSTVLNDDEVREIVSLISHERLGAFLAIAGTERDALALHHQTMALAAALMPVIGLIEIAIRNATCERLRQTFGNADWLQNPPLPFRWKGDEADNIKRAVRQGQRAAYTKKSQAEKKALDAIAFPQGVPANISHERKSKKRQEAISITTGQLIAQLTLFFWKRLFSDDYEDALWKRSLRRLFPKKTITRAFVATHLEALYQARNRIAHHEPIYGGRLVRTQEAVAYIMENFSTGGPTETAILQTFLAPYMPALDRESAKLDAMIATFTVKA